MTRQVSVPKNPTAMSRWETSEAVTGVFRCVFRRGRKTRAAQRVYKRMS